VAPVRHLPEGDLGGTSEENVLRAVSYKLHKCSAHVFIIVYVKIIILETNYLIVLIPKVFSSSFMFLSMNFSK
jgi:hypothetical protein